MKQNIFKNTRGVSNTTIATLVIASLLVSIVGTWLVLESFQSKYIATPVVSKVQQSGYVQLSVSGPADYGNVGTTGLVAFKLEE